MVKECVEPQALETFVSQLLRGVIAAEFFAVLDNTYSRVATDAADVLQFGSVATVEVEDGVFFDMPREDESHAVAPERIRQAERVVARFAFGVPGRKTCIVRLFAGIFVVFPTCFAQAVPPCFSLSDTVCPLRTTRVPLSI